MKNKIFINTSSYGNSSHTKWHKVSSLLPELEPVFCSPANLTSAISDYLKSNDTLFIGGGDGTLHHAINGLTDFERVRVGCVGLGSSCSFLKSYSKTQMINGIPMAVDLQSENRIDLGKITFKTNLGKMESKYFIANGSVGFLALANLIFNQARGLVHPLKSFSTNAANNYVFLKTLFAYKPTPISINAKEYKRYLNIQFLKSKHYTSDYCFDRENAFDSGLLDFHFFNYEGKFNILEVFYSLTVENEYFSPNHTEHKGKTLSFRSNTSIPLELDGEIYFGNEFEIECVPKKLRLLG